MMKTIRKLIKKEIISLSLEAMEYTYYTKFPNDVAITVK